MAVVLLVVALLAVLMAGSQADGEEAPVEAGGIPSTGAVLGVVLVPVSELQ